VVKLGNAAAVVEGKTVEIVDAFVRVGARKRA
jgi:hypothetical protein